MKVAQSYGELFDQLQRAFGISDFDESRPQPPWHKVRAQEIGKLKAMSTRRRLSFEDWALVAGYAARRRIPIGSAYELLGLRGDALRERAANARSQIDLDIDEAVLYEQSRFGHTDWVDRLLRASGPGRQWVLDEWRAARKSTPTPESE